MESIFAMNVIQILIMVIVNYVIKNYLSTILIGKTIMTNVMILNKKSVKNHYMIKLKYLMNLTDNFIRYCLALRYIHYCPYYY